MMASYLSAGLKKAASLWMTLFFLLWVGIVLLIERLFEYLVLGAIGWAVTPAFIGLFINLMAAIATNYQIRQKIGLLVFHLALASIALLVAFGRLSGFKGNVEVTVGSAFDAEMVGTSWIGMFHFDRFKDLHFIQGPFSIKYAPGMKRRETESHVMLKDPESEQYKEYIVGDDVPLKVGDFRLYTTFNKGFAPVIVYENANKVKSIGSVHMPSYPIHYYEQGNEVDLPVGDMKIDLWLRLTEPLYDEDAAWEFRLPDDPTLIVKALGERFELKQGQWVDFDNGSRLKFEEVRPWMGYTIFYDPTVPWILAASILACLALLWHIGQVMFSKPWDVDKTDLDNKENDKC